MSKMICWSYGGGVQSVALAVMVAQGKLPKPDCAVMADTGREGRATLDYLYQHVAPMLAKVGVVIEIAPHSLASVDLYSTKGELLIPAYTEKGMLDTYCSGEWKRDVVSRYLRLKGFGPKRPVKTWIGFSYDEFERAKPARVKWQEYTFPLLEHEPPITRAQCVQLITDAGLPPAPKSSCWMCPYRGNAQWRDMKENHPNDFEKACRLDEQVRAQDRSQGVYVHKSRTPLRTAILDDPPKKPDEPDLFSTCASGHCFV